jgi:hypothetical protein
MRFLLAIASLPAALLGLSAVAAADSPPPPPKPQPKDFCIELYQPVCGTKDGERKTYSNRCFATVDGAIDIGDGPCTATK